PAWQPSGQSGASMVVRISASPNPGNGLATFQYEVPGTEGSLVAVELAIFDVSGRRIELLVSERQPVGTHRVEWRSGSISAGIYFARLTVGDTVRSTKIVVTR